MSVFGALSRKATLAAVVVLTAAVAALPAAVLGQAGQLPPEVIRYADQIWVNGKIITVDSDFSIREAVAVRDGRILAVGTTAAIQRYAGPQTQRIDLAGKTMIPGIIDTHIHLMGPMQEDQAAVEAMEPKYRDYRNTARIEGRTLQEALQNLKRAVDARAPGTWVSADIVVPEVAAEFQAEVTRNVLDWAAPNNPLVVEGKVNSQVIEEFRKKFGDASDELVETGEIDTIDGRSITGDLLLDRPLQSLYEPLRKRMLDYAQYGVTTWSSSLTPVSLITLYRDMDRRGDMPMRFAFSHSIGATSNPEAWKMYMRLGDLSNMGTDMLWINGSGFTIADREPTNGCMSLDPLKRCQMAPGRERRLALYEAIKNGQRLTNTHVSGDKTADYIMDVIEEASAEAGFTPEQIRAKAHAMDHCGMYPRPDQIQRGLALGIIWNCGGNRIDLGIVEMLSSDYGEAGRVAAQEWVSPVASILEAGGRVTGHGEGVQNESFFDYASMLVTRTNSEGVVWGREQAIDRTTMLKMYTIWGAEYVGRPDRLGSIEPGKFADFAVLDKDFMAVPDAELKTIKNLLTVVGGKVVFQAPTFRMTN